MRKLLQNRGITMLLVLIGMLMVSAAISPTFRTLHNIMNVFNQNAVFGVMALGIAFVALSGSIDLSLGSTVALTGVVAAPILRDYGFVPGVLAGLAVGLTMGFTNGILIAKAKINFFVVTLGTQAIGRGLVYIITNGMPVTGIPRAYNFIGSGRVGPFPVAAMIWIFLAICLFFIFKYTRFGQYLYAVGGNETAAWLSGVNKDKTRILAYTFCGLFGSIAGLIKIFRVLIATADGAAGYELTAIASCVVGGIALDGGRGNVLSAITGTLILGLILNLLQLTGVSSFYQSALTGLIIISAVGIDSFAKRKRD
jgi:ribose/xylose/arabinose/galactoside ABC-type transport system permease subunit